MMSGHHELGFSSLNAYVAERCERGARWASESRALARKLCGRQGANERGLPAIRAALVEGSVLWSMAEMLSASDSLTDADARVAALERVRDRCSSSNPLVAARASFEAGHTYEREVGDKVRAADAYRLAGTHSAYEAAAATAIARLAPR